MFKEIIELVVADIQSRVPELTLKAAPLSSISEEVMKSPDFPKLVLQGPGFDDQFIDYTPVQTYKETRNDVKVFDERKATVLIDLAFRLRYFHNSLIESMDIVQKLISMSISLVSVTYGGENYNVIIDSKWRDDLTPNLSDLKHYESTMIIEEIKVPKAVADREVFEFKESFLVAEKKENGA